MNTPTDLIVLPGSLGVCSQLRPLTALLEGTCNLHPLELLGHGGRPIPGSLTVQAMAADVLAQMDHRGLATAHVLGYSFGGYVALYLAHAAPERIRGVCNIAAKVVMDERAVRRGLLWARDHYLSKPGSANHALLEAAHSGVDWRQLVKLLAALYQDLGKNPPLREGDFQSLKPACLTICGDGIRWCRGKRRRTWLCAFLARIASLSWDEHIPWRTCRLRTWQPPSRDGCSCSGDAR